ncbi:RNA-binding protein 43 [Pholidichthys leucotaenia]
MNHSAVTVPEMDFPVEATIILTDFQDKSEVRKILKSHGFDLTDVGRDQVHVKGNFSKLKAAKACLEQLARTSSTQAISSGAIPKKYNRDKSTHVSPSSHSRLTSQEYRDYRVPPRAAEESIIVDADTFKYADTFNKKEIKDILHLRDVQMNVQENGDTITLILLGKNSRMAVDKLQDLFNDLNRSLRTQEVPLKEMSIQGEQLLKDIQKNKNIYNSVLVCEMKGRLHLIGSSRESYDLKQKLLTGQGDCSGRTGRTLDGSSRRRSSSLPPISLKSREDGSQSNLSPGGAAGPSSKYRDDKQESAVSQQGAAASSSRRRSMSESRSKKGAQQVNGNAQEKQIKSPKSPKMFLSQLRNFDLSKITVVKQMLSKNKK